MYTFPSTVPFFFVSSFQPKLPLFLRFFSIPYAVDIGLLPPLVLFSCLIHFAPSGCPLINVAPCISFLEAPSQTGIPNVPVPLGFCWPPHSPLKVAAISICTCLYVTSYLPQAPAWQRFNLSVVLLELFSAQCFSPVRASFRKKIFSLSFSLNLIE